MKKPLIIIAGPTAVGKTEISIKLAKSLGGEIISAEGACPGHILTERRGTCGFGYDPLFLSDELGKTFAEINMEEKNRVSHRARALAKLGLLLRERSERG